ncbi:TonB-dependent receptor [Nitrogeniibacter mangrovi]|uniref:TonB-dependent receptor n=1 Tax=Nitrogeniibacter mangrovi TaxID=2016596 RepID=A0A6C1B815_9RHOO|nr:TonB-dependent receptor [Nitrogeniibacter mangrovi]QID19079.1 TonB-dependent receptor [Nitrogeniibacter mangrovi]
MRQRLLPHLALIGIGCAGPVFAAAPVTSELALFGDVPVVLSAARLIQPLNDAPGAVTVIDRDMIRASGARDVAELLRFVPGIQIGRANGATPLTSYHGLSDDAPRRMLVRVDGRSAYSPYFVSGIEWAKISVDIDDIERIEVFRGTNAAAYGSNAFLGVVNIITRPAAETPRLRARITEGANGLHERMVSIRQRLGDATARLTLGQQREDGLDGLNDSYRHQRADARVDWQLGALDTVEFHFGFVDTRAGKGVADSVTDPERTVDSYTGFGEVRWRRQLNTDDEIKLTYFHQEERAEDPGFFIPSLSSYLGVPSAVLLAVYGIPVGTYVDGAQHTRALRDDLEFEHLIHPGPDDRIVWGAGLRSDRVASQRVFNTRDDIDIRNTRLFANLEHRQGRAWTFNAGALLEDTDAAGPRFSPRLAANLHLTDRTTARAAWSRGYRNLTPFERRADVRYAEALGGVVLFQSFQPSGELPPERVTTRELGLRHESADHQSNIDLRVYVEQIRDMIRRDTATSNIVPAPPLNHDGEAPKYIGGGAADIHGTELSFLYRSTHDTWIGGHYAYTHLKSNDPPAELSAPHHAFALFASIRLPHDWQMSVQHGFVGGMSWYDSDPEDTVRPYHYSSARIAKRWRAGVSSAELAVGMDRIGGGVSDFHQDLVRPPEGYVTLRLTY